MLVPLYIILPPETDFQDRIEVDAMTTSNHYVSAVVTSARMWPSVISLKYGNKLFVPSEYSSGARFSLKFPVRDKAQLID